jgi:hypothetical protein
MTKWYHAASLLLALGACERTGAFRGVTDVATYDLRSAWPNEPAGFTQITDNAFDTLAAPGWAYSPLQATADILADAGAPLSPPHVMRFNYPATFPGGHEAAQEYYVFPGGGGQEYYFGVWWRPSDPWQSAASGINEVLLWQAAPPSSANLYPVMNGQVWDSAPPPGRYFLSLAYESSFASNAAANLPNSFGDTVAPGARQIYGNLHPYYMLAPGNWYRIEVYVKESTTPTSRDGILRLWITKLGDAAPTQVGDYTSMNFDGPNFTQVNITQTWGRIGEAKAENDYLWYDHIHISSPTGH